MSFIKGLEELSHTLQIFCRSSAHRRRFRNLLYLEDFQEVILINGVAYKFSTHKNLPTGHLGIEDQIWLFCAKTIYRCLIHSIRYGILFTALLSSFYRFHVKKTFLWHNTNYRRSYI